MTPLLADPAAAGSAGLAPTSLATWLAAAPHPGAAVVGLALAALALVALGFAAGALVARARRAHAEAVAAERATQLAAAEQRATQERTLAESLRQDVTRLERERATLAADLANAERATDEKLALLAEAEKQLREAFQALSAEALRQNNQSFLTLATEHLGVERQATAAELEQRKQAIEALVKPVSETLAKVDTQLRAVEKEREGAYASITEQLAAMAKTSSQLQSETRQLVDALRRPNVRGRWGEIQLRRVVELAGMLDRCDFTEQEIARDDEGHRLRPDLLVHLPGGKRVVVDAKAPLAAYLDAVEAPDDATREAKLRDHARQVRDHIAKLGARQYWAQFQPAPEFVVLFLPGETFFHDALQHDPTLLEYGFEQKVIPASPTTLIALLRAVAYGWRQERVAENAEEIARLGRSLHDRIGTLVEHLASVGQRLGSAVRAYNEAVGSVEARVLPAARRFEELGAGSASEVPVLDPIDEAVRPMPQAEAEADS